MSDLFYNNGGTEIELGITAITPITPPPPPKGTLFSSTEQTSSGGYAAEDAKMGHLPVGRVYWTGAPTSSAIPSILLDGRVVCFSFKVDPGDLANGVYDSQIQTHLQSLPSGQTFYYCYYHEPEGNMTGAQYRAAYNHFVPLVKGTSGVSANIIVTSIFTAFAFSSTPQINISDWWPTVTVDCLGIDYDGRTTSSKATSIHDFSPELHASTAFAKSVKTYRVCAPEFGEGRISTDSDGSNRTAWMQGQVANFVAEGLDFVNWYDFDNSPALEIANPSKELTYWRTLVAQSS